MAKKKKTKQLYQNEPRKPFVFESSYDVVIVGAGASGLACAVSCAQEALKLGNEVPRILVLEQGKRVGTSILRSGNGRCNFSNSQLEVSKFHNSTFVAQVFDVLEKQNQESVLQWFEQLGLVWTEPFGAEGLLYPYSNKAISVLEVLQQAVSRYAIDVRTHVAVESITLPPELYKDSSANLSSGSYAIDESAALPSKSAIKKNSGADKLFALSVAQKDDAPKQKGGSSIKAKEPLCSSSESKEQYAVIYAKRVVVAVGGAFDKKILPTSLKLNDWEPVLGPLTTRFPEGVSPASLDGVRAQVEISSPDSSFKEKGEVLFREYGISGIVVFNASRYTQPGETLLLDFVPGYSEQDVLALLQKRYKNQLPSCAGGILKGIFVPELATALLAAAGISANQTLSKELITRLSKKIKTFPLLVEGIENKSQCQVNRGGVPVSEANPETLETERISGMYVLGEALDVDGPCGGYNLHWAWACGLVAGRALAKTLDGHAITALPAEEKE